MGAKFRPLDLEVCAWAGPFYDVWEPGGLLPTASASGGGCGVPQPCPQELYPSLYGINHPSAGGGLIWLSANSTKMGKGVKILADGSQGIYLPYGRGGKEMVSGSG